MNDLKELQKIELEILIEIDRLCKKHNLKYYLNSGTALGAIRHKGFIPWDDDIDIAMPIKDYKKFSKIAPKELNPLYFFQDYHTDNINWLFSKVRRNGTTCIEKGWESKNIHQGAWVDIFPIIAYFDDNQRNIKTQKAFNYVRKVLKLKNDSLHSNNLKGKRFVLKFIPQKLIFFIVDFVLNNIQKNHFLSTKCVYIWGGSKFSKIFDTNDFNDIVECDFEKYKFYIQKNYHSYLQKEYGDYMTPPPLEDRNGGSHEIAIIDLQKNFTEYIK